MATGRSFGLSKSGSDEAHDLVCSICSEDDKDVEAIELCMDCEQYLCRTCSAQHRRFKGLREHSVVKKDQVRNLSLSILAGSDTLEFECTVCEIDGKSIAANVYCMNCRKYLCSSCLTDHDRFGLLKKHDKQTVADIRQVADSSPDKSNVQFYVAGKPRRPAAFSCEKCRKDLNVSGQLWVCINCAFSNMCKKCCEQHQLSNCDHRAIPFKEFQVIYEQYGRSVISGSGKFMGPVCSDCSVKGQAKNPISFCSGCNVFICIGCRWKHSNHRLLSDSEVKKMSSDVIAQMENIKINCMICYNMNQNSSAVGYCLQCDVFICCWCLKLHLVYFEHGEHRVLGYKEVRARQDSFFEKNFRGALESFHNSCSYCKKKGIRTGAMYRCLDCKVDLCMLCLDFHETANDEHSLENLLTRTGKKENQGEQKREVPVATRKLTDKTELGSANEKTMPAGKIFDALIDYLITKFFNKKPFHVSKEDIKLALLVAEEPPATVSSMLKNSATKIGLDKDVVSVVSKQTCMIEYCQMNDLPTEEVYGMLPDDFREPGKQFLAVDLGDDQTKVSVLERSEDGTFRNTDRNYFGEWGMEKCVTESLEIFPQIFGQDIYREYCKKDPERLSEMQRDFAEKILGVVFKSNTRVSVKYPIELSDLYKERTKNSAAEAVGKLPKHLNVKLHGDNLRCDKSLFETIVASCITNNTTLIRSVLTKHRFAKIDTVIFYGTLLDNQEIKQAMGKNFNGAVIVSSNSGRYVSVCAAVISEFLKLERISRNTYGINICQQLNTEVHTCNHKIEIAPYQDICPNVFKRYFMKGEKIYIGEQRCGRFETVFPYQRYLIVYILQSERREPKYASEGRIMELGKIEIDLGQEAERGVVEVRMMFTETKLLVEAFLLQTDSNGKELLSLNCSTRCDIEY